MDFTPSIICLWSRFKFEISEEAGSTTTKCSAGNASNERSDKICYCDSHQNESTQCSREYKKDIFLIELPTPPYPS
jgi:hypothetical protein